jgi:hypothetical protein
MQRRGGVPRVAGELYGVPRRYRSAVEAVAASIAQLCFLRGKHRAALRSIGPGVRAAPGRWLESWYRTIVVGDGNGAFVSAGTDSDTAYHSYGKSSVTGKIAVEHCGGKRRRLGVGINGAYAKEGGAPPANGSDHSKARAAEPELRDQLGLS